VVADLRKAGLGELQPRSVAAPAIAQLREGPDLVGRHEVLDAVGERLRHIPRIAGERLGGAPVLPSTTIFKSLWQVPVIQRAEGLDTRCQQGIDEPVVEVDAFRIRASVAVGKDSRPGDGKAEGLDA
jgi:hypothetical protein